MRYIFPIFFCFFPAICQSEGHPETRPGAISLREDSSKEKISSVVPDRQFVPADGRQGERRERLMQRLHENPYPDEGAWHYIGLALGSYWTGDPGKANEAILELAKKTKVPSTGPDEKIGFHWAAFPLERVLFLFGSRGVYRPGEMSAEAEKAAKQLLWSWLFPRASKALVDPSRDWWEWESENHHLQAWNGMWGALQIFNSDPEYAKRTLADGSSVPELKRGFDDYFKRWIRHRATKGFFVECNSPSYAKYALAGFYNLVDFSDDAELARLAGTFLDLYWAQWALEQVDGIRGGSRHRSYPGGASIRGGSAGNLAWYHFGFNEADSVHPSAWCTATSGYIPPPLVSEIALRRGELGTYTIQSRLPGLGNPSGREISNYVGDPSHPLFLPWGVYNLDPNCGSLLRSTYMTPSFALGTTMLRALPHKDWMLVSSQNRWDGVLFSKTGGARIFVQPGPSLKGAAYNTQWSVQNKGAVIVQKLPPPYALNAPPSQRIWFSSQLSVTEKDGWVFAEAAEAYAAVRVVRGGAQWQDDTAEGWHSPKKFQPGLGKWLVPGEPGSPIIIEAAPKSRFAGFEEFQKAILNEKIVETPEYLEFHSGLYDTTLALPTDLQRDLLVDGTPVSFEMADCFRSEVLEGRFGGETVRLHAFGKHETFDFSPTPQFHEQKNE